MLPLFVNNGNRVLIYMYCIITRSVPHLRDSTYCSAIAVSATRSAVATQRLLHATTMMKLALLAVCAVLPGAIADAGDCTANDFAASSEDAPQYSTSCKQLSLPRAPARAQMQFS